MDELLKDLISVPTLGMASFVFGILYFGEKNSHKESRQEVKDLEVQLSHKDYEHGIDKLPLENKIHDLEREVSRLQWKLEEHGIYD